MLFNVLVLHPYECKVDPNREPYTFYVLTTPNENDTSVNLIMDSNINISGEAVKSSDIEDKGLVEWINNDHFLESGGEVTDEMLNDMGMCELAGICVLSTYGPIIAIEYLQTATEGWTNTNELIINKYTGHDGAKYPMAEYILNARMPVYLSDTTKTEVAKKTETNSYLYDNLTPDEDSMTPPHAYWTLSSNDSNYAWTVGYNDVGTASVRINHIGSDVAGVRPVINLSI